MKLLEIMYLKLCAYVSITLLKWRKNIISIKMLLIENPKSLQMNHGCHLRKVTLTIHPRNNKHQVGLPFGRGKVKL